MNKKQLFFLFFLVLLLWFVQPSAVLASCVPSQNGTVFTVGSDCAFSGTVDGVDAGTGTINTATLQVSGATLTIGNNQSIVVGSFEAVNGGEIIIPAGGSINLNKPLWMTDADGDGYPANTLTKILSITQPANAVRVSALAYSTVPDGNDDQKCAAADTPSTVGSALYSTTCQKCTDGALVNQTNSEDLYNQCSDAVNCNGSGACACSADGAVCTVNSDCCTGSCTSFYTDSDGDTYGVGSAVKKCGTSAAGYATNNTDCNDADAAQYSNTQSTGGTITTSGGYRIHKFTSSGTFTPYCLSEVEVLVVAGGGGGGCGGGGGGGGGGLLYNATYSVTSKSGVTVTVGDGGVRGTYGGSAEAVPGQNGKNSVFGTMTATGGGGGGGGGTLGKNGGSGGGTGYWGYDTATGGSGVAGQGTAGGGNGYKSGVYAGQGGGGGGGAGHAGYRLEASDNGGAGGNGALYSITGSNVYYAGGGGGWMSGGGSVGGGGGGAGGTYTGAGTAGTANTGGGGGAGGNTGGGGTGGSGVVIVRYAL